jgi:HEAT repeat protein
MALVKRAIPEVPPAANGRAGTTPEGYAPRAADLRSEDAALRRRAVRALSAMPEAVPLLCAHLANEPDRSVRSIVFAGLIGHASPQAAEGLLPLLRSNDANLRNGAIEALQEMPDAVARHVERLLADADSDVRIFAVNIVGALRHADVPAWLRRVVTSDPHVNVCTAALDALSEVGEPDVIPALQTMKDRFPDVAFISFAVDATVRRILGR